MSNVVGFLEALSLDGRGLSEVEYVQAVDAAGLDETTRQALMSRDQIALRAALGARANVMAFILPAEDEPNTDQPDTDEPDGEPKEGERDPHNHNNVRAA
jgi:hypothetical protein